MREYKFRGKMTDVDEWIYGTLLRIPHPPTVFATGKEEKDKYYIQFADPRYIPDWNMPYRMVQGEVILNTIGQYTGLHDKNGKEIYEGDIIPFTMYDLKTEYYYIVFRNGEFEAINKQDTNFIWRNAWKESEVIGNIYDNPELLEKGE